MLEKTVTLWEYCQLVEVGDYAEIPYQGPLASEFGKVESLEDGYNKRATVKRWIEEGYCGGINHDVSHDVSWDIEWDRFRNVAEGKNQTIDELLDTLKLRMKSNNVGKFKKLVKKVTPVKFEPFEKLILPQETKDEIIAVLKQHSNSVKIFEEWGLGEVIKYGRGMVFLFHGFPGTGKTYCAHIMAEALGKKLVVVGTAELQSQEPGAFERNLRGLLQSNMDTVVLLDECDGMVQSRQGMGQIISAENNTLLQEIEKFEGVLVMTTNRIQTLDEALERRVSLIIEFPMPNKEARVHIWKRHLPNKMPLGKEVKVEDLAEDELSGGQIKNAVLNAARFCVAKGGKVVDVEDFTKAIKRAKEGSKAFSNPQSSYNQNVNTGKTITSSNFGPVKFRPEIPNLKQ